MKTSFFKLFMSVICLATITGELCAQVPAYVPTDGLVGWWPFNGNANDESGNGNDGVVNGAVLTEDRFGNVSKAYQNGNQTPLITVPNFPVDLQNFSCSYWVKYQSYPTNTSINDISHDWINGGTFTSFRQLNSQFGFASSGSAGISNQTILNSPSSLEIETWHHLVLNRTSEIIEIYLDGSLSIEAINENGDYAAIKDLFIGGDLNSTTQNPNAQFLGVIDDISIYNRALTESEIQSLFTGQCPTVSANCTSLPSNLQEGLVGYWPFCGNANDESGNGNDGVVNGATLAEDRFGNAGSAYSFDGSYDYIETQFDGSSSLTASVWMNSEYPISWYPQIIRIGGVEVILQLGVNSFYIENNMVGAIAGYPDFIDSSPFNPSFNTWHHIVLVHDHNLGLRRLYIDNELVVSGVTTDFIQFDNSLMTFGNSTTGFTTGSAGFLGTLDDIAIWNRALTPEEVQELYTLDACTFTVYDTLTVENVINVYDTLTIENIVDIFDTTYINVEVYDTLTVENIVNVYDTLTVENIVDVYDTTYINVEVYDTLTVENVIDVYDTTTVVETMIVYDTLTVENIIDVYDTTYITVTDTLIIDVPSGVGGIILNTLLLYPNPTSEQLTINYGNFAAMAGYSLSIFDNGGSAVHQTNINQVLETLDISQWSAGVYQVVVYNAGGVPVETRQIVIQ